MSNHPLSENLTKLSTEDLDKKYSELLRRYTIDKRMNMPSAVIYQLELLLEGIEVERYDRVQVIDPNEDPVVIDTDRI